MTNPNYEAAWRALSEPLSWMHENPQLKHYWGWNLAEIANDLIERAYPSLRSATPAPAVDEQEGDDEGPCTDCGDTGITIQTERACSCEAGDEYRAPAVDARDVERVGVAIVSDLQRQSRLQRGCYTTDEDEEGIVVVSTNFVVVEVARAVLEALNYHASYVRQQWEEM